MRMRRVGIAVAIISTLSFACRNEPNYPTPGMSNGPAGSFDSFAGYLEVLAGC